MQQNMSLKRTKAGVYGRDFAKQQKIFWKFCDVSRVWTRQKFNKNYFIYLVHVHLALY